MYDIFLIWKKQGQCDNTFPDFKQTLNTISNLNWEFEELSEAVKFLDLNISVNRKLRRFEHEVHVKKEAFAL